MACARTTRKHLVVVHPIAWRFHAGVYQVAAIRVTSLEPRMRPAGRVAVRAHKCHYVWTCARRPSECASFIAVTLAAHEYTHTHARCSSTLANNRNYSSWRARARLCVCARWPIHSRAFTRTLSNRRRPARSPASARSLISLLRAE